MDPVLKNWMFFNWIEDKKQQNETYKNFCVFLASFSNPEAAKRFISENDNTIQSSEEDFEKSLNMVKDSNQDMEKKTSLKRRRRKIG